MVDPVHFLDGGGEMADAIREHDWSANPLGPPDAWPPALKTALSMALNSKFPKCVVWGPELIALYNDAFRPILGGKHPTLGQSFRDIWREAWTEIGPIAERAYAGEATFIEDFPLVIDRFGYSEQAYFTFCYSPIRDESGTVRGMIDTVIETTRTVDARQRAALLSGELSHRIKNTLAVISAIVSQTFQSGRDIEETQRALMQRIGALADAQNLLTGSVSGQADIREVMEQALRPFHAERARLQLAGPAVTLSPKQAVTLTMAVNELATNALKYGALSAEGGEVRVTWTDGRLGSDDMFRFIWAETGGPPVSPPSRRGFGSRIIEDVLAQDFAGESKILHDPQGVRCELSTRMINIGADRPASQ